MLPISLSESVADCVLDGEKEGDIYEKTVCRLQEGREALRLARERFGGEEQYEAVVDVYVDALSDDALLTLAEKLRDMLRATDNAELQWYREFNVDPLIADLEKGDYGTVPGSERPLVKFVPQWPENIITTGRYLSGQVTMFVPTAETILLYRQEGFPTDGPRDIRFRVKHFLKFGGFGAFSMFLLHELTHSSAGATRNDNLIEAHAYSFTFKGIALGTFNLDRFAGKKHPEYEIAEALQRMSEEEYRFLVAKFISISSLGQDVYKKFLQNRKAFSDCTSKTYNEYNFSTDQLVEALHAIYKLRVLGHSEREIGWIIGTREQWDESVHCYPELDALVADERSKREWSNDDLGDRVLLHKINEQAEYYELLTLTRNFFKERIQSSSSGA